MKFHARAILYAHVRKSLPALFTLGCLCLWAGTIQGQDGVGNKIKSELLKEYWQSGKAGRGSAASGFSSSVGGVKPNKNPSFSEDLKRRHFWLKKENAEKVILEQLENFSCNNDSLLLWWGPGGEYTVARHGAHLYINALEFAEKDETYAFVVSAWVAAECINGNMQPDLPGDTGTDHEIRVLEALRLLRKAQYEAVQGRMVKGDFGKKTEAGKAQRKWLKPLKPISKRDFSDGFMDDEGQLLVAHLSRILEPGPMPLTLLGQIDLLIEKLKLLAEKYSLEEILFINQLEDTRKNYLQPAIIWQPILEKAEEDLVNGVGFSSLGSVLKLSEQFSNEPEIAVRIAAMYLFLNQEMASVNWLETAFRMGFRNWERLGTAPFDQLVDHPGLGYLRKRYPRY